MTRLLSASPCAPNSRGVAMDVTETLINAVETNALGSLAHQEGGLGAAQHVAVHAVGAQHHIVGKGTVTSYTHVVVLVAFGVLDHPNA